MSHIIALRKKEGTSFIFDHKVGQISSLLEGANDFFEYSPSGSNGKYIVVNNKTSGFIVFNSETGEKVFSALSTTVMAAAFSPMGNYLCSYEKASEVPSSKGNVAVWNVAEGKEIFRFRQNSFKAELWPALRWTPDEQYCAMLLNNNLIRLYANACFDTPVGSLKCPGTYCFDLAREQDWNGRADQVLLSVFTVAKKNAPGAAQLFVFNEAKGTFVKLVSKTFFKMESATMYWNIAGSAVLFLTHDSSSESSYYGESQLYFLGKSKPGQRFSSENAVAVRVELDKKGPIHSIAWNPNGKDFIVVYGASPCKAVMFDQTCKAIFSFGTGPRNFALYAPHGRFIALAGFGNVHGDVEIWDRNKLKKFASITHRCSVSLQWSPCSRYFLTAVTAPRMRVDNGFSVYRYCGERVFEHQSPTELYSVCWQPKDPAQYPDRPISPEKLRAIKDKTKETDEPEAKSAYVPPHMRGKTATVTTRPGPKVDSLQRKHESSGRVVSAQGGGILKDLAHGDNGGLSKNALKNKKKKEAKQRKKVEENTVIVEDFNSKPQPESAKTEEVPKEPVDPQKEIRKIKKKLQQITKLKAQKGEGKELERDQLEKLESEPQLLEQLKALELNL